MARRTAPPRACACNSVTAAMSSASLISLTVAAMTSARGEFILFVMLLTSFALGEDWPLRGLPPLRGLVPEAERLRGLATGFEPLRPLAS
mmetsp:Transcript_135/g.358  ORF Transcript_135/g.358 Transcript_135/m.358 type:complete len:90 (-) Transcript_135:1356-1625(-)